MILAHSWVSGKIFKLRSSRPNRIDVPNNPALHIPVESLEFVSCKKETKIISCLCAFKRPDTPPLGIFLAKTYRSHSWSPDDISLPPSAMRSMNYNYRYVLVHEVWRVFVITSPRFIFDSAMHYLMFIGPLWALTKFSPWSDYLVHFLTRNHEKVT
jgi:hypothetical protein